MSGLTTWIPALYLGLLGLLSLHGLHRILVMRAYWRTRQDRPERLPLPDVLPVVTVQLPVFNEAAVVERLIDAACALDWPMDRL